MTTGRAWLSLGGALCFACSAVACSALLGFEDRSLDTSVEGGKSDAPGQGDGSTDGSSDAPNGALGAPTDVIASKVEAIGEVKTMAGTGLPDFKDDQGVKAAFKNPYGVVVEPVNGNLFVADPGNARIRKITPGAQVTTFAGSGVSAWLDGTGTQARFDTPGALAVDGSGNIFVPEYGSNRIRMVTPGAVVTTLAGSGVADSVDGTGSGASFNHPIACAVDLNGNVYVADYAGHRIRKVTSTGVVSTMAGSGIAQFADGTGDQASFSTPAGIAVTPSGDAVYVADNGNNRIRKITQAGVVTTVAGSGTPVFGDGKGELAGLSAPTGLAFVAGTGDLYFSDSGNSRVRRIIPDGTVSTLAGQALAGFLDAKGALAKFDGIQGIALDKGGAIYVADYNNHRIRRIVVSGVGDLEVTWKPPVTTGTSSIRGYTATATAAGHPSATCSTTTLTTCIIGGLVTGVPYSVTVKATNALETGPASAASTAAPN